jgi:phosphotransferase system, enzyme I, PtsP
VLRALKMIVDKGRAAGKPVALCGELASTPLGALALVAIGYRVLSLTAAAVGPVKAMLLDLDAGKASALLDPLLERTVGSIKVRDRLEAFAAAEGLQL